MSSTGRSDVRHVNDFYTTPSWCVEAIAKYIQRDMVTKLAYPPAFKIIDPGAGCGNITFALHETLGEEIKGRVYEGIERVPIQYSLVENDLGLVSQLMQNAKDKGYNKDLVSNMDFFQWSENETFNYAIGNPPYNLAMEFVEKALKVSLNVIFLLRIDFLGSLKRGKWYRNVVGEPDIYVLERRPSFTGDGSTDSNNYAWFWWTRYKNAVGHVRHLPCP